MLAAAGCGALDIAHHSDTGPRVHDIGRSVPLSTFLEHPLPFLRAPSGKKAVHVVLARRVLVNVLSSKEGVQRLSPARHRVHVAVAFGFDRLLRVAR